MVDRDAFLEMMRRTASGVSVVTTDGAAGRAGVTVSAVCSVSLEPPSVLACVYGRSAVIEKVQRNRGFCINILGDDQHPVAECFAGRVPALREDRFACAGWHRLATGAPALDDAIASLDCQLTGELPFGSHVILIGTVLACDGRERAPLIYTNRGYGVAAPLPLA
jgi:flavin reductase (DIM6/NTAB) family NADH-FMN oxidoreductase RutF